MTVAQLGAHLAGDGRLCDVPDCTHAREVQRRSRTRAAIALMALTFTTWYAVMVLVNLGWSLAPLAFLSICCARGLEKGLAGDKVWQF